MLTYIRKDLQREQISVHSIHFKIADWAPLQPSNGGGTGEDCASIYVDMGFRWNDADCSFYLYYPVCEKIVSEIVLHFEECF